MTWLTFIVVALLLVSQVKSGEPPPLRVVPPANATEKELLSHLKSTLPIGWSVDFITYGDRDHFLQLERLNPTLVESTVPNGPPDERPTNQKLSFWLRVLPLLPLRTYRRLHAENESRMNRMNAIYGALAHEGFAPSQSGGFISMNHKLNDEDRKNIAAYHHLGKELKDLPEFYFHDISLEWTISDPITRGFYPYAPWDPAVFDECKDVIKMIEAKFTKY